MKDLWINYPVWYYIITSFFFEFYAKTNLTTKEYSTAAFIFPLSFFVLYVMKVGRDRNDKYYPLITTTLVIVIWGMIDKLVPPLNFTENTLKWIYEISNFILWSLLVVHAYFRYGKRESIEFFVITLIYGFLLESNGVEMKFFLENDYHIYLPVLKAPLVTMIGWSGVFYTSYFMFEKIKETELPLFKTVIGGALTITLTALFWDMSLDPVASNPHIKFWVWNKLLASQPAFMRVPILNFVSWFWAVFVYALIFFIYKKKNYPEKKGYISLSIWALIALFLAGAGTFITMGIMEGFSGPSWKILLTYFKSI